MEGHMDRPLGLLARSLLILLGLAGCQTTMSVEEAKKVTASFAGAAFVPPPRTISDITAILDQQKRTDVAAADEARERADQTPPPPADAQTLRQFYFRRGLAARAIGRTRQEIDDLTTALGQAPRSTDPYQYNIWWALRYAEMRGGNLSKAIEHGRRAIEAIPDHLRGDLIVFSALQATTLASRGDLRAADAAVAVAERAGFESLRWTNIQRPEWIVNRRGRVAAHAPGPAPGGRESAALRRVRRSALQRGAGAPFRRADRCPPRGPRGHPGPAHHAA
jgi:tetratricopeptide (TPR) repeat protein